MKLKVSFFAAMAVVLLSHAACAASATLQDAYRGTFVIGAALNANLATGRDARGAALVAREFNSISPENDLKWERIHPRLGQYDFAVADQYVAFGVSHHMYIVGHALVWHNQAPDWVFRDGMGNLLSREALLKRLRDHIFTVVGRYKGHINAWDVVNEAVDDTGGMRPSLWYKIIGEDYVAKAFEYAHEADPQAELIYNDYSIENPQKRNGVVALIRKLKAQGVPISTVGIQGHYDLTWPTAQQLDDTIAEMAKLGVKVAVTELDFDVLPQAVQEKTAEITLHVAGNPALDPYKDGLPLTVSQQLADRYAMVFRTCLKYKGIVDRVTVWGVSDANTWKNDWPVKGRTNYPLLFDRNDQPKDAYYAVLNAVNQ